MHPVIILALLVGVLLFISWYKRAPSGQQKRIRGRMLLFGGLGIVLLLLVTGHLNPVIAAIFAALAIGQRVLSVVSMANMFKGIRNSMKGAAGPSAGNVSDVETRYLRMSLNHDTGEMEGVVLEGTFKGRRLSELGPDELMDLLGVCRAEDDQSASVLEAYLDRVHGDDWREHAGGPEPLRALHVEQGPGERIPAARERVVGEQGVRDLDRPRRLAAGSRDERVEQG